MTIKPSQTHFHAEKCDFESHYCKAHPSRVTRSTRAKLPAAAATLLGEMRMRMTHTHIKRFSSSRAACLLQGHGRLDVPGGQREPGPRLPHLVRLRPHHRLRQGRHYFFLSSSRMPEIGHYLHTQSGLFNFGCHACVGRRRFHKRRNRRQLLECNFNL